MIEALNKNWKVYSMESLCLGIFMVSAAFFSTMLESDAWAVREIIPNGFVRLCLMGIAMGATATAIIYSPVGKLSGAHMNPAVSFTFARLGKMKWRDALYYAMFQSTGGVLAVYLMSLVLGDAFRIQPVGYVVTIPGKGGVVPAFFTEVAIAFFMMTMVLITSNHPAWSRYTGGIAGVLVMLYVIISGPVSGFSMNPARTIASAIPSGNYTSLWIYFTAPFIGMLGAAELFRQFNGRAICAKMVHVPGYRCIFNCGYCTHTHEDQLEKL